MRAISRNHRLKFSAVKIKQILSSRSSIYSPGLRVARLEYTFIFIQNDEPHFLKTGNDKIPSLDFEKCELE